MTDVIAIVLMVLVSVAAFLWTYLIARRRGDSLPQTMTWRVTTEECSDWAPVSEPQRFTWEGFVRDPEAVLEATRTGPVELIDGKSGERKVYILRPRVD